MSFSLFTITGILWCLKIWCLLSMCLKNKWFINTDLLERNIGSWQLPENVMVGLSIFKVLPNTSFFPQYIFYSKKIACIFKRNMHVKKKRNGFWNIISTLLLWDVLLLLNNYYPFVCMYNFMFLNAHTCTYKNIQIYKICSNKSMSTHWNIIH